MTATTNKRVDVDGLEVFYREAGPADAPVLLLLHGFPSSSHMFRDLIPKLAGDTYRVIAPDLPGFGQSAMPAREAFAYTFDTWRGSSTASPRSWDCERFAIYVFDYGAPVGMRLATWHPERITAHRHAERQRLRGRAQRGLESDPGVLARADARATATRCASSSRRRRRSGSTRTA
jgi:alpha-beta hydrolase superfamily lysophospholipase